MNTQRGIRYGSRGPRQIVIGRSLAALSACLVLSACGSMPAPLPPPEPIIKTVTVEKIVPTPCVMAVPDVPIFDDNEAAIMALTRDFDGARRGIALLRGGRAQRDAYIQVLRGTLQGCIGTAQ